MIPLSLYPALLLFFTAILRSHESHGAFDVDFLRHKALELSRREALTLATGGVSYGKLNSDSVRRLAIARSHPKEHESKVASSFRLAIQVAMESPCPPSICATLPSRTLEEDEVDGYPVKNNKIRVLEIGIGPKFRTVQSGLYNETIDCISHSKYADRRGISIVGVDLLEADLFAMTKARAVLTDRALVASESAASLSELTESSSIPQKTNDNIFGDWTLDYAQADASNLPFPDSSFDAAVVALALCSVVNQEAVLHEIQRVLKPKGTLGWVEHVAVEDEDDRPFLDWQQRALDPLQKFVANNCHLHRHTGRTISKVFDIGVTGGSVLISQGRFYVKDMWPVSCQEFGVLQKT